MIHIAEYIYVRICFLQPVLRIKTEGPAAVSGYKSGKTLAKDGALCVLLFELCWQFKITIGLNSSNKVKLYIYISRLLL